LLFFRHSWLQCFTEFNYIQIWSRPATWSTCLWAGCSAGNAVLQWQWQVLHFCVWTMVWLMIWR